MDVTARFLGGVRLIYFRNASRVWSLGDDVAYDLLIEASSTHLGLPDLALRLESGFSHR